MFIKEFKCQELITITSQKTVLWLLVIVNNVFPLGIVDDPAGFRGNFKENSSKILYF